MRSLSIRSIKSLSRTSLHGHFGIAIPTVLLFDIIVAAAGSISQIPGRSSAGTFTQSFWGGFLSVSGSLLIPLIIYLLISVFKTGLYGFFLKLARRLEAAPSDLFAPLQMHPDRIIIACILVEGINILLILPYLLVVTLAFGAVMRSSLTGSFSYQAAALLLLLFFTVIWVIAVVSINLNYVLIYYLFWDDTSLSGRELLAKSRRMMAGSRLHYLGLYLSFIGMFLLSVLSFGIGFIWVSPYIYESYAHFYLDVAEGSEKDL